jgi:large subunit ribosomal protein L33
MAKNKGTRITIHLECTECKTNENKRSNGVSRYTTQKNRRNTTSRIELKNSVHIVTHIQFTKKLNKILYKQKIIYG